MKGERFCCAVLVADDGGSDYIGEFRLTTNDEATIHIAYL